MCVDHLPAVQCDPFGSFKVGGKTMCRISVDGLALPSVMSRMTRAAGIRLPVQ
jgi:hypothetical protein